MDSNKKLVWSDEGGDQRKTKPKEKSSSSTSNTVLTLRRLTSGKGRTVVEISNLPNNKEWCKALAKDLKKSLGVGGTYKQGFIEIHGEKLDQVKSLLDKKSIQWKQTGG